MIEPTLAREQALHRQGFCFVAGLDEAGRGAWAGPVVAAAVILPPVPPGSQSEAELFARLQDVRDSKLMTPRRREKVFDLIQAVALTVGVGVGSHGCIDRQRIIFATRYAMGRAVENLQISPRYLLIDALPLPDLSIPQTAFPKADRLSLSVAAASIIAKVTRDRLMVMLDERYPGYQFARHKGYGTKIHQAALSKLGPCRIHRHSFAPINGLRIED